MRKLTIKQEKFALVYFETGNATEAYRQVYDCSNMKPESINRLAKANTDNIIIASRIQELKDKLAKKYEITLDTITMDFIEARNFAKKLKKPEPMIIATAHIARLHGIGTDDPNHKPPATAITLNFTEDMFYNMLERFKKKKIQTIEGNE